MTLILSHFILFYLI